MKAKQKFAQKLNFGKERFKQVRSVNTEQKCERCNGHLHPRMKCLYMIRYVITVAGKVTGKNHAEAKLTVK